MSETIRVDVHPPASVFERFPAESAGWTLQGDWQPNLAERRASWDLLVELLTRITVVPLGDNEGLLREALASLHAIFGVTREILKRHGPDLAAERRGELSFAVMSAHLLNRMLRPVTASWHPRLRAWEVEHGTASAPTQAVEMAWEHHDSLRELLKALQGMLSQYTAVLAAACDAEEFRRILHEGFRAS